MSIFGQSGKKYIDFTVFAHITKFPFPYLPLQFQRRTRQLQ